VPIIFATGHAAQKVVAPRSHRSDVDGRQEEDRRKQLIVGSCFTGVLHFAQGPAVTDPKRSAATLF
jgi:hypothetical protein